MQLSLLPQGLFLINIVLQLVHTFVKQKFVSKALLVVFKVWLGLHDQVKVLLIKELAARFLYLFLHVFTQVHVGSNVVVLLDVLGEVVDRLVELGLLKFNLLLGVFVHCSLVFLQLSWNYKRIFSAAGVAAAMDPVLAELDSML